ncbi:PHP domain-containing protein [Prauserella cavernicola]|uniref:PHP domain-containing protein n=1 Tax=Prauserella cavernicola TaxID=2800127 RepID=A0A934V8R3_9PSEU|nr:PHP domain-containing protein [Prauserella cavernicola]MBK1788934.1 PHP domain-containing protein [Prauserella cavernicola]
MVRVRIDLHTHSTVSDGTDSPAELVATAAAAGLGAVALTDHDTTAGWQPAIEALPPGLRLVPGAELSCESVDGYGRGVSVHLLAYLFDPTSPVIVAEQQRLRKERRDRLRAMAVRMAADGLPVDPDEILGLLHPDAPAGRPHLAQALVRAGLVDSVDEAFSSYLANGRGYYVSRRDTPVETAIEMIAEAGGVTVLAHPFAASRGPMVTPEVIAELAQRGLTGVEVDHPNHDDETRAELRDLAKGLGLVRTGSSDYHGTNKTIGIGQETTDPEEFEALVAQASGAAVQVG